MPRSTPPSRVPYCHDPSSACAEISQEPDKDIIIPYVVGGALVSQMFPLPAIMSPHGAGLYIVDFEDRNPPAPASQVLSMSRHA